MHRDTAASMLLKHRRTLGVTDSLVGSMLCDVKTKKTSLRRNRSKNGFGCFTLHDTELLEDGWLIGGLIFIPAVAQKRASNAVACQVGGKEVVERSLPTKKGVVM